mgnify:CR=1 FL=1
MSAEHGSRFHPWWTRAARVALATVGLLVFSVTPALAHGEGDATESRVLVLQALTYLTNRPPGYEDMASDKIGDALDAPDQEGVTLADVESAQQTFESGDLTATRDLLQQSVLPLDGLVTGEESGTTIMLDPLTPSPNFTGLEGVLAGLSAAALVGGIVLSVRGRPTESIHDLQNIMSGGDRR